jgi:hypothetical protein
MSLKVEVSAGEFLDKMAILKIKSERIRDPGKLQNVQKELALLQEVWVASPLSQTDISAQMKALKHINEKIWEIEDGIRELEANHQFGAEFVQLARSVYINNDERAAIKREINDILGSALVEEKSYTEYKPPAD